MLCRGLSFYMMTLYWDGQRRRVAAQSAAVAARTGEEFVVPADMGLPGRANRMGSDATIRATSRQSTSQT